MSPRIRIGEPDRPPLHDSVGSTRCIAAIDGMKQLSAGSIGAVITDPPFHVSTSTGRNSKFTGDASVVDPWTGRDVRPDDPVTSVDDMVAWTMPLAEQVGRIVRPGGAIVVLGSSQSLAAWELCLPRYDCHWMAELTVLWNTGKPRARNFGSLTTAIRWYVRQGARHTFNAGDQRSIYSNVIVCDKVPLADREHPSQKPVELTNVAVSLLTNADDTVLDPFCGSGSTLVSAAICGRRWLGFDTDELYCRIAERRAKRYQLEEANLRPIQLWVNGRLFDIEG